MTPAPNRVKAIFMAALDADAARRAAVLDELCAGDATLRDRVAAMLRAHDQTDPLLDQSAADHLTAEQPAEERGTEIAGRYRLREVIGEGGMGSVWLAEQTEPVRRTVAIKLIKAGMDSRSVLARFEAERQTLALMDHPHIAKVLDGGTTAAGRPFFVMEYVPGVPLTEYCDAERVDVPGRLALFVQICQAVQHAHQKGVIHRDLKPGNILVRKTDAGPVPKVIDFGLAKAVRQPLTDATLQTGPGMLMGTLQYMAPEQAEVDNPDVDTRADVYALGVILYELLTGTTPVERQQFQKASWPEVLRLIQQEEPPRPSARLSAHGSLPEVAARRSLEPVRLKRQVRGDLDWIVMKALEKDRSRRYDSAGGFAADISRYLTGDPVVAHPPSRGYRLRKFVRRHRPQVIGVAGVLAAMVLGLIGTVLFAVRAADQRARAEQSARAATDEKRAALSQSYRARLAAAVAALQNHDVADAARHLAEAPAELRGWEWHHLHSRLDDRAGRFAGRPGEKLWVLPWPGGVQIARSGPDGRQFLTDLDGRRPWHTSIKAEGVMAPEVHPTRDGYRVVGWLSGNCLCMLDEAGNESLRVTVSLAPTRLSPDGTRLAVAVSDQGRDGVALYDTVSGERKALCVAHRKQVLYVAFSPDGTRVATTGEDGLVYIWHAATGAQVQVCRGHTSKIISLAFRPDGARLATASADGSVRQWDPVTGQEAEPAYERHTGEVLSAAYSPDGEWVASGGADRTVRLWRASGTGRHDAAVLHGHTGAVYRVAFSADGRRIASLSQKGGYGWAGDDSVGVWEVDFPGCLPVLRGHTDYIYPVAYSPDGRWIASGAWDKQVRVWDARTGELCRVLDNGEVAKALAFSRDGSRLVSGRLGVLQVWDVAAGECVNRFETKAPHIHAIEFHPDGATFAALGGGGGGTVFNAETGAVVATLPLGSTHDAKALAYSPDGRWLAGTSEDQRSVCLFDARTYELVTPFAGHEDMIRTVAFSADSRYLASAGVDRTIRVWEIDGGACRVLRGHTDEVFAVAFHPDGRRLATGGQDRAVWIWDLSSGEELVRLPGHAAYVWSLAFTPDGATLVSGSGDKTVRLWDTAPLALCFAARREAMKLRPEAERLVRRLFAETHDAAAVAAAVRADLTLDESLRHEALRELMRGRLTR